MRHHAGDVPLLVLDENKDTEGNRGHKGADAAVQATEATEASSTSKTFMLCAASSVAFVFLCCSRPWCPGRAAVALSRRRRSAASPFPLPAPPQAQPPFVRGVLLLHSFEYDDAIAAFREAQRADPGFAMAYWGEALCLQPAALVQRESRQGARGARAAGADARRAPGQGADRAREGVPRRRRAAVRRRRQSRRATAPTPIAWRELTRAVSGRRRGGGVLRAGAARRRSRRASAIRRCR